MSNDEMFLLRNVNYSYSLRQIEIFDKFRVLISGTNNDNISVVRFDSSH